MPTMPSDKGYDDEKAKREGWAVFECDDGKLRIQRLDCPKDAYEDLPHEPVFQSDYLVIVHVAVFAHAGSGMHQAALALHNTVYWDDREPIGARMEDGTIVTPWDERLRAAGGAPIYDR